MNIKTTYESKNQLAQGEINKDGLTLALLFKRKNGIGVLLATKADPPKFKIIKFLVSTDKVGSAPFTLIASGHQRDFGTVGDAVDEYVRSTLGVLKNLLSLSYVDALEILTDLIGGQYDKAQTRALALDLLLISAMNGTLEMTRINYSGEAEACEKFAVLGGFNKIAGKRKTLNAAAVEILDEVYKKKKLPKRKAVTDAANRILALKRDKRKVQTETLEMDQLPEDLKYTA